MKVTFDNESGMQYPDRYEAIAADLIEYTIDFLKCPYECQVNVLFTDNSGIKEINDLHRGIDRATDVLSFPNVDFPRPCDYDILENDIYDIFEPESGELLLGDIVISLDKVKEQSLEYGHSDMREVAFLIVHSMLHLFGFDHMTDEDRREMEQLQDEILNSKGYDRDYE